jgi:serine/threonine protein phosphatase PrpC
MKFNYYGLSDKGNLRDNNEDYVFAGKLKKDEYLFIIADGMGGHQAGEIASRKAVCMFVRQLEKEKNAKKDENNNYILERLKQIVMDINETLIREGSRSHKKNGMGTTFSALYIKKDQGYIVHVGDSRIYLFPGSLTHTGNTTYTSGQLKQLSQLTEDHSFVGKLLKDGLITEGEARSHPKRNVLFQSIGIKREITIQTAGVIPIQIGQKFLLCSDGLYGVVPDSEIEEYLNGKSTAQIAEALVKRAKFNGGPDNISVIAVSTEADDTTNLQDTVKITTALHPKIRKTRVWCFILLGLLVLLLALIIYILLKSVDTKSPPSPTSPKRTLTKPSDPQEQIPGALKGGKSNNG